MNEGTLGSNPTAFVTDMQSRGAIFPRQPRSAGLLFQQILPEPLFLNMLCLERKRAERSNKRFILVLIDAAGACKANHKAAVTRGLLEAINATRGEADLVGWHKQDTSLGMIFTELDDAFDDATARTVFEKVEECLSEHLPSEIRKNVNVSAHVFGDVAGRQNPGTPANPTFYPDLFRHCDAKKTELQLKRLMDVVGSCAALLLFFPIFVIIAAIIKLTSKGPVLFRQERLGQFGHTFNCLKFRTMRVDSDPKIHQEFVKGLIRGRQRSEIPEGEQPVYKMTHDPRITTIGRLLRKTSLDELPQFINVLRNEMSLVGPRPPIAYEFEEYDVWHRRRVLEIKPGITGLWQVKGRSRVKFDDMVRLDLQYARGWSLWLDIQIILKTPGAVVFGGGAF
jgi:lipopolysaccharide/colanic/teichoic acid biosynthesis glycosyltransferase